VQVEASCESFSAGSREAKRCEEMQRGKPDTNFWKPNLASFPTLVLSDLGGLKASAAPRLILEGIHTFVVLTAR
jgi:hypothetical protein